MLMPIQSILFSLLFLRSSFIASLQTQFPEYPPNPHLFSGLVLDFSLSFCGIPVFFLLQYPVLWILWFSGQEPWQKSARRLSKPLVRDDGRVYSCSERNLFAFESNGSIAWTVNLNYTCNVEIAPIHGGSRKVRELSLLGSFLKI